MIIIVESVSELELLIQKSKALALDFYADWCGPCIKLGKFLESIKDNTEYKDIVFCKVNVDNSEFEKVCTEYSVSSIPYMVFFKDSKQVKTLCGYNEPQIKEALKCLS